jgi:glycerol-3-phosphate acyltransferase PlsX
VKNLEILVDAMGGDNAPRAVIEGCIAALKEKDGFKITLLGDEEKINKDLINIDFDKSRMKIIHTSQEITGDDIPTKAVRNKKDSSMVVGLRQLKEKKGNVFISAGNTGALMATSLLTLGRIKGVDRPALSFFFPTNFGPVLIIDVGANTNSKPDNYAQFGVMGSLYMKEIFQKENPKVGLLNIGSEAGKGNETLKQAYSLLEKDNINFIGNIEGRDIPFGEADVVVCDGFIGNILLKFLEGVAMFFSDSLKEIYTKNMRTKLSALAVKGELKSLKKKMDYSEYGGVPLLGVNGRVVKTHGSSNAKAFKVSILNAIKYGESTVVEQIAEQFKDLGVKGIG